MSNDEFKLAVIGTAGRQSDGRRITRELWDAMYDELLRTMDDWGVRTLVSGGAAVADHLAVRALNEGRCDNLELYIPAPFRRDSNGYAQFRPHPQCMADEAAISNRYHRQFSQAVGIDSLWDIDHARMAYQGTRRCLIKVIHGFKARNLEIATQATHLLAFTFGAPKETVDILPDDPAFMDSKLAGLKDGGTAHTFSNAWRCKVKRHVSLTLLERKLAEKNEIRPDAAPGFSR